jgi:hypothetical protein
MIKLKTMIGLCALSALAICAFATQAASAQTWYLCSKAAPTRPFTDAHCKNAPGGPQEYGHIAITPSTTTPFTWTNITTGTERSVGKLKSVQAGITLEIQATEVEGTGTLENKEDGGVMFGESTGVLTFKNVTVTLPAGKGCKVAGGTVTTKELKTTTKGLTNQVKAEPGSKAEGKFAEFSIEGCTVGELNHVYTATGSVIGNTEGTTTNFSHAAVTTQGTLKLFGQKAGIECLLTTRDATTGEGISVT